MARAWIADGAEDLDRRAGRGGDLQRPVLDRDAKRGGPLTDNLPWWFPRGSIFTAILFAMLAVQNYQLLQEVGRAVYYEAPDDRVPWEK